MGRIFAQWMIFYFGKLLEDSISIPNFRVTLFHGLVYALILTKHRLGYFLGDFVTNSSGHPDWK
jgi:hypothetical protein